MRGAFRCLAAVAFLGGEKLNLEEQYLFQKLARAVLGTPNVDYHFRALDARAQFAGAPWLERVFTRLNILDSNSPDRAVREVNFVELRCDVYRRDLLEAVGGLNEDLFRSNEDQDLSIRIIRRGARLLQDNSIEFQLGFGGTEVGDFELVLPAPVDEGGFGDAQLDGNAVEAPALRAQEDEASDGFLVSHNVLCAACGRRCDWLSAASRVPKSGKRACATRVCAGGE